VFRDFALENRKSGDVVGSSQVCSAGGWSRNRRCDSTTVIEQETRFLRLELPVGKACEMKHAPKAVTPVGEV
jgi:hypothetical protein